MNHKIKQKERKSGVFGYEYIIQEKDDVFDSKYCHANIMISLKVLFFILMVLLIIIVIKGDYLSPDTLFTAFWTIAVFLSSICAFGVYDISDKRTSLVILIGVLSFDLGTLARKKLRPKSNLLSNDVWSMGANKQMFLINDRLLLVGLFAIIIFDVPDIIRVLQAFDSGETYEILRSEYWWNTSSIFRVYLSHFFSAFRMVYSAECVLRFMLAPSKYLKYMICTIVLLFEKVLVSGGRMEIIVFIIQMITAFIILRNVSSKTTQGIQYNRQRKRIVRLSSLLGACAFLYMSFLRGVDVKNSIINHLYLYLTGGIFSMDQRLELLDKYGHTNSAASLYGFWSLILPILHFMGVNYPSFFLNARDNIIDPLQTPICIGDGVYINAFTTAFFHPFVDFGFLGVIVMFMLCGIVFESVYLRIKEGNLGKYGSLYLLCLSAMLMGINNFVFVSQEYFLAFLIYLIFVIGKKRLKI